MTANIFSQSTLESTACPPYPSYIEPVTSASSDSTGVSSTTGNAYSTATRGATPIEISSSTRESFVIFETAQTRICHGRGLDDLWRYD